LSAPCYRLTRAAAEDIAGILRHTLQRFGLRQHRAYERLLVRAAVMIAEQPFRPASRDRGDLLPGLRSFHLGHAARRRGATAHLLLYRVDRSEPRVLILRVLHEAMDPARHLADTPD
jgi:toxin ParE1/3/4